jgi:hypothetical protein
VNAECSHIHLLGAVEGGCDFFTAASIEPTIIIPVSVTTETMTIDDIMIRVPFASGFDGSINKMSVVITANSNTRSRANRFFITIPCLKMCRIIDTLDINLLKDISKLCFTIKPIE